MVGGLSPWAASHYPTGAQRWSGTRRGTSNATVLFYTLAGSSTPGPAKDWSQTGNGICDQGPQAPVVPAAGASSSAPPSLRPLRVFSGVSTKSLPWSPLSSPLRAPDSWGVGGGASSLLASACFPALFHTVLCLHAAPPALAFPTCLTGAGPLPQLHLKSFRGTPTPQPHGPPVLSATHLYMMCPEPPLCWCGELLIHFLS